jgi:TonB family protein
MRPFRLNLGYTLCLAIFATAGCGRKSTAQIIGELPVAHSPSSAVVSSPAQSLSLSPSLSQTLQAQHEQRPAPDLSRLENNVRPAVFWVAAFDPKGNLLRTQSGFFISRDGRFVTTARAIEGAVNAVVKTADGGIFNVSGILTESKASDLAVLQADVKQVAFLEINKHENLPAGSSAIVIGSGLAGTEGSPRQMSIAARESDRLELAGATPVSSIGSPVINQDGQLIGVVISAGEKTVARPSNALDSELSRLAANAQAHWPEVAEAHATPKPTPKPRITYAPAPAFPSGPSVSGQSGTGRFRLTFDGQGNVTNIQVVKSTGNPYFDQSALKTLRQWKSAPSQGWQATVPVTFQTR